MGSTISKYYEDLDDWQWRLDKEWIEEESKRVGSLRPETQEFRDYVWLSKNKEKILRNRKLIELLG